MILRNQAHIRRRLADEGIQVAHASGHVAPYPVVTVDVLRQEFIAGMWYGEFRVKGLLAARRRLVRGVVDEGGRPGGAGIVWVLLDGGGARHHVEGVV